MKPNYQTIRTGLVALAIGMAAQDASATAIASVDRSTFFIATTIDGIILSVDSQADSVTKTELGNATVTFTGPIVTIAPDGTSLSAQIGGTAIANPSGYALGERTFEVTVAITNLTGSDLDLVRVGTSFGPFNPGGPTNIGARVDDSTVEFARFFSSITGTALSEQSGMPIGSLNQCDTRNPFDLFPSPPPSAVCGIPSPDTSEFIFRISDLDQNETVTETFTFSMVLEASSSFDIPEPSTLALLGAGLMSIVGFRMFKKYT